jgi:cytidylate kinase
MIVAIDGTSGSGKSTIAKQLAIKTGFELLNTGLIYRKITKICIDSNILPENIEGVLNQIKTISFEDIQNQNLHTEIISKNVPFYAKIEEVRKEVRKIQRNYSRDKNIIVEGRDIGSVVFPDAEIKLFIDANIDERAKRRMKQLELNSKEEYLRIVENLRIRDSQDENRTNSPLIKSKDAIFIDTTNKTVDKVISEIIKYII